MLRAKNNDKKITQLQIGILNNGRQGNAYVASLSTTRTIPTSTESAHDEAYNNSNGFPYISGLLSQGGISRQQCIVVEINSDRLATDVAATINSISPLHHQPLEYYRLFLIPLGTEYFYGNISQELHAQVNQDIRKYDLNYYEFTNHTKPTLHLLGKIALPNPERYCDFKEGEVFTLAEEANLLEERTKAVMAVSHGLPPASRFELKMVELVPHTPITSVTYRKQTQQMVQLPIAEFERKIARARGIPSFIFSSQIKVSQVLADFNEGKLPPPAWSFSFGKQLSLSIQHDYHYLSNTKHPEINSHACTYVTDVNQLMNPMPPVYFSYIGGVNSYGVFAAKNLAKDAVIDVYAGIFSDSHNHPNANNYCYRPVVPGYQYSYCQGVYALEQGNCTTFINSAEHENSRNAKSPDLKVNVAAELYFYKKTPLIVYRALKPIAKDTQLVCYYEDLVRDLCPRHFTFFKNGASITANAKVVTYAREDIAKGLSHYKQDNYDAAKLAFKSAHSLLHACMTQFNKNDISTIRTDYISACEYLANTYEKMGNKPKAIQHFTAAIVARKAVDNLTNEMNMRITLLTKKVDALKASIPVLNK